MAIMLRPLTLEDAEDVARLSGVLGYPSAPREIAERLAGLLPSAHHHFAAAVDGEGRMLGWIAAERRLLLESGVVFEITGLVVDPSGRRSGAGKALVADAERWVMSQGAAAMTVRSNALRAESHPFYERQGYVRRKTQHVYVKKLDL